MKKLNPMQVCESLIKSGILQPESKKPFIVRGMNEALRLVRAYHDMSQSELSVQLGISNSFLSEIESGKKQPTLDLLNRYSDIFGVPISSLLFFSENLHKAGITSNLRVGAAKKVISLLQWVEAKSLSKSKTAHGSKEA